MIPELGHFALIIALCLAVVQSIVPLLGATLKRQAWIAVARPAATGQFVFIAMAFACLVYAFISNDFSILYVAENSNTHLPLAYRICAVWGAHEGSLLLWVFILSAWMMGVVIFSKRLPDDMLARVLAVMGMISFGFLLFLLMTSDPFARLLPNIPVNGADLNPLLQDPGFVSHPPMLYAGYVGFSVAFAFAIAGLLNGKLDKIWVSWVRPWTLLAWSFLTLGIVLGSWWSYRELGWGGWWFWDPVENASFMPWLVGTALIHSLAVTEKRGAFQSWSALLAIFAFTLSLIGTFLVRSGILISVHAFAIDPARGAFMLKFIIIVVGVSLTIFAWRASKLKPEGDFKLISRETFLLSNNVLLTVAMLTVLIGTLYPLILQALNMGKISVGPPYFNTIFIPIMVVLLIFMSIGPQTKWRETKGALLRKRIMKPLLIALLIGLIVPLICLQRFSFGATIALALASWVALSVWSDTLRKAQSRGGKLRGLFSLPRGHYGMVAAHMGMAVCVIGVVMTSMFSVQNTVSLKPGDTTNLAGYHFEFKKIIPIKGSTYNGAKATIVVTEKNSGFHKTLYSEKHYYPVREMALSKVATDFNGWRDLYVALGSPMPNSTAWSFRVYYKPFVSWIWLGGVLMLLGGLLAASDKHYRQVKKQAKKLASLETAEQL